MLLGKVRGKTYLWKDCKRLAAASVCRAHSIGIVVKGFEGLKPTLGSSGALVQPFRPRRQTRRVLPVSDINLTVVPTLTEQLLLNQPRRKIGVHNTVPSQPVHPSDVCSLANNTNNMAILIQINAFGPARIKPLKTTPAVANSDLAPQLQIRRGGSKIMAARFVERLSSFSGDGMSLVCRDE